MIDFSQLGLNTMPKPVNPRDIFMGLTQKNAKYQYPRDVQGEVWKQWFELRNNQDNIVKMNTGSGKTVVALMILQSCINEGFGPALYVVPDKYLVEQVIFQARDLGIKVVDTETDLDYQRKKAILVINIQKLVNGKSVFGLREENNYSIGSVIIDDIHACIGIIQEQFSITIPRSDELYMRFAELFYEAMNIQAEGRFNDIIEERNIFDNMLVPFWNWQDKNSKVYEMLSTNLEKDFIKFKFDLVKDCLKLSHCYISSKGISIIPNCTPIHKIASFDDTKRRIYMSATLPDDSPFSTVMGVDLENNAGIITPEKANDIGERLILVPKIINKEIYDDEVRDSIINKSNEYNVVVLVPSFAISKYWKDRGAVVLYSSNISEGIQQIKESSNGLYVIVNRYDGIDLPDSACRILVIDGLPNISNMNDKYEQEVVRKSERIQREQIQRIEQGMGRGVRSNSDFCLVFLIGNQLTNMLYTDDGYNFFSKATKEQFLLSEKMCEQFESQSIDKIMEIGDYLLKRNNQWISICKSSTSSVEYERNVNISDVSVAMRKSFNYAEIGDYQKSTDVINEVVNKISNSRVKGYYKQLLAEYMNFIDRSEAQKILKSAKKDNLEILNPMEGIQFSKIDSAIPEQSRMIVDYITRNELDENKLVIFINSLIADLKFEEGTSKRFENAIAEVFQVIGYIGRQPESEVGKGPDDFVILGEGDYLVIECKNETTTETINKHDCNQLNGSYNWFGNLYQDEHVNCVPIMIHNSNVFEFACSPNSEIRIMTPDLLSQFNENIHKFIVALCQENNFKNIEKINGLIKTYSLGKSDIVRCYTKSFVCKLK